VENHTIQSSTIKYNSSLSKMYNLPHIHTKNVIQEVLTLKNELGEEITAHFA
jgi:hypothetical protein